MGFSKVAGTSLLVLGGSLALSGCAGWDPFPSGNTSPSSSASAADPTATATDTPATASPSATPFEVACDSLLSLQDLYDINPNLAPASTFSIPSQLSSVIDANGTACGWVNLTSNETIAVGVARPGQAGIEAAANDAAATLSAVPTYGTGTIEGYFGLRSGSGVAETIGNDTIVVIVSPDFVEPGDAAQVMELVRKNLS